MKKFLLIFTIIGFVTFSACQEKPKPETIDETPTMEQALQEAGDPNDFTANPLVGELVSLDHATKGDLAPLTPEVAAKVIKDGGILTFKVENARYIVLNKADNSYAAASLAPMAGKKIALYGMSKLVNGVSFFIMEKMEEAK